MEYTNQMKDADYKLAYRYVYNIMLVHHCNWAGSLNRDDSANATTDAENH